ncbi:hypothetical protein Q8A67_010593 [Cirrhinus molitorella]|uniref:Dynein light chain n=1 Tax=Cirrhinus molitorella TaxID=172907 RepID=A0AA88TPG1_9TELE|nr:hypothetical protein Q8A67_010593 [Cirrhinus molitorella]
MKLPVLESLCWWTVRTTSLIKSNGITGNQRTAFIYLATMSNKSYQVIHASMSDEMQRDALQCVLMAEYMYKNYNDIAKYIAKEFDRKHQPNWHCIVGSFGSHNPTNCEVCFYDGNKYILLFKP